MVIRSAGKPGRRHQSCVQEGPIMKVIELAKITPVSIKQIGGR